MIYSTPTQLQLSTVHQFATRVRTITRHVPSKHPSLVFGSSIVRGSLAQHCAHSLSGVNTVNRLWYGRALVSLRTLEQATHRASACARLHDASIHS
jgi:hypothetical protein